MPKTKRHQAVDNNFEQILAEIAERQRTRQETAKHTLKTEIIPRLKNLGVVTVQASYSVWRFRLRGLDRLPESQKEAHRDRFKRPSHRQRTQPALRSTPARWF